MFTSLLPLSEKLGSLAITLGLLSNIVSGPAIYEITPKSLISEAMAVESPKVPPPSLTSPILQNKALTQANIRTLIVQNARKYGVSEVLALSIAVCESNFEPTAKSPSSSAKGIAQFINSTWFETMRRMGLPTSSSVFDPKTHVEAFVWLLKNDGVSHWEASKKCWQKML